MATDGLIREYREFLENCSEKNVGCLTCNIVDRNFSIEKKETGFEDIDYCITSGSLMNVEITLSVGGFDESMFIDKVDCDVCINLKKHGYRIVRIDYEGLLHEIVMQSRLTWDLESGNCIIIAHFDAIICAEMLAIS